MSVIGRACPGWVRQTLENSCWAAVLEAWSRVDPRMPTLRQQELISRWGEDDTGSINPERKIPPIARACNLSYEVVEGRRSIRYLSRHLGGSHIFCSYNVGAWSHSVLIYRLRDEDVSVMDPDGGRYRLISCSWFQGQDVLLFMRIR